MRFSLIMSEVFTGLRRNISMVISVILVTFVSLSFVGAAMLMQMQVGKIRDYWEGRAQVAVYMCTSISSVPTCAGGAATPDQIEKVRQALNGPTLSSLIQNVRFETREEAFAKLQQQIGSDYAGLVTVDQMNQTFWINLKDQTQTDVISEQFGSMQGVEEVKDQLQYLDPLFQTLTVATYIAVGIAGLMLIAAVLLIGTTIRLSAYARRREIGIMRLVGASNRFIQTPFILEGVFAAFIGTILASAAVVLGVRFGVEGYLQERVQFITTWVELRDTFIVVPVIVVIGVVLAALSASFAIRRWLRT